MRRAGIFIGVNQTGQLRKLEDASAGARRMYDWAISQGMRADIDAILITDEGGKRVTVDMIYDAIKAVIDGPGVEQLIVYFAGHGVNINRCEYWLLSDAPVRANAAVNVSGSVDLARYCGIPYVVFLSDACRVAAEGIQAQNVRGSDVFPNDAIGDRARPVDQFFACVLGRTAAEIKDPQQAAAGFSALYTSALLDALYGQSSELVEPSDDANDKAGYIKPARLRDHLEREIPRRIVARGLAAQVNQSPDAIVTAHSNWLARLPAVPPLGPRPIRDDIPADQTPPPVAAALRDVVFAATAPTSNNGFAKAIAHARKMDVPGIEDLIVTAARVAQPFGVDHHESACGIKVQGARIVDFLIGHGRAELADAARADLRVHPQDRAQSVLLVFDDGIGTVVPVVPGFLTVLTCHDGELLDMALEPSANHPRWALYQGRAEELRRLRGVAAAASQQGRFRLDGPEAGAVAKQMQYAKTIDPALALYAAYAYHDLQQTDRLRQMSGLLHDDLGVGLFDVDLLARVLRGVVVDARSDVMPFVPMLAQGWALVDASGVCLPAPLAGLRAHLRESLWSLYDPPGVECLRSLLLSKEIR